MESRLKLEIVDGALHMTNLTAERLAAGFAIGPVDSKVMDALGSPVIFKPGEMKVISIILPQQKAAS
jgi:hypothetical protein